MISSSRRTKIVIVGGGVAGCALAYQLGRADCSDVILFEKAELTSGSTWHAAGNVPLFNNNAARAALHARSLSVYAQLAEDVGNPLGLHQTGSLELACSEAELRQHTEYAQALAAAGIRCEVIDAHDALELFPYLNIDGVLGAAWTPTDGYLDPSALTFALADAARGAGVEILRHTPVVAIEQSVGGDWCVRAETLEVRAKHVVNAAGLHAREVSALVGHRIPAVPMERQYIVTDAVPGIETHTRQLPVLRDASAPFYIRQEQRSLLLGLYDQEPVFWALDGTPPDFNQELLTSDLERVEGSLRGALNRIPVLSELGIKTRLNGPLMRTPDAEPLVGPVRELKNFWLNTGYFAGIAQSGACAEALAAWILDGKQPSEYALFDPARFGLEADAEFTKRLTREEYVRKFGRGN